LMRGRIRRSSCSTSPASSNVRISLREFSFCEVDVLTARLKEYAAMVPCQGQARYRSDASERCPWGRESGSDLGGPFHDHPAPVYNCDAEMSLSLQRYDLQNLSSATPCLPTGYLFRSSTCCRHGYIQWSRNANLEGCCMLIWKSIIIALRTAGTRAKFG
jgi:hypothetical protein